MLFFYKALYEHTDLNVPDLGAPVSVKNQNFRLNFNNF